MKETNETLHYPSRVKYPFHPTLCLVIARLECCQKCSATQYPGVLCGSVGKHYDADKVCTGSGLNPENYFARMLVNIYTLTGKLPQEAQNQLVKTLATLTPLNRWLHLKSHGFYILPPEL